MMTSSPDHEEREIKLSDVTLVKGIWPFIRPYFWMLCVSVFLVFIVTFLDLMIPVLTQKVIDGFIIAGNDAKADVLGVEILSFKLFSIIFLAVVLASLITDFAQAVFMEYTGQKIILYLRCSLFRHMSSLPVSYFDEFSSGRLVSRVAGDVENMNEIFSSILVFVFRDLVLMIGILVMMFSMNPALAFQISLLVPLIIISIVFFSKVSRKVFRTIRQKVGEINHVFSETVSGIKIIQTSSGVGLFLKKFSRINTDHFRAGLFQIRLFAVFMPFIGFLSTLGTGIIIWTGGREILQEEITIGVLVAFLSYIKMFFRPVRDLSEKFNLLQNALASAERIVSVLDRKPFKDRIFQTGGRINRIEHIEFDRIRFSYKTGEEVLTDISFSIRKGQALGIAGHTGSGKSSLINLITGFYRPDSGTIRINGKDGATLSIRNIRDRTALVMQDPVLFSTSVRDNIQPPEAKMDDKALENVLKKANCDFLFQKHSGLDTMVREGGRPFSSGEKQLLCIARAFAFNPDLIIFDEATSYMDTVSEQKVHQAMQRLMKGRISIIIAHRLNTVRECDNILLLQKGKIRESGSHEQLMRKKGEYYHLLLQLQ
ncbi:MAG: ABC transporter ATP-binding protein [Desulfobacteraceae bacterium]